MRIDAVNPGNPLQPAGHHRTITSGNQAPSFKETLATFLADVNNSQKVASEMQKKLLTGEVTDAHQVMATSEEATVAFNMLVELRSKTLDGYQEVMRLKV